MEQATRVHSDLNEGIGNKSKQDGTLGTGHRVQNCRKDSIPR
jgi:hypothetical protein